MRETISRQTESAACDLYLENVIASSNRNVITDNFVCVIYAFWLSCHLKRLKKRPNVSIS